MAGKEKEPIEEQIIQAEYSDVMQRSYIDYAMSVIVSRALPDVRDGLKPVQRRALYDMQELGVKHDKPYRKSARIVGDTMGKYHPHGDSSIYDSIVVMAQEFKKEMPLVDGHGNFGSIEGDGAAAMRYTEARLEKVTQEAFLSDLDKDVVDFVPNFDETEQEPSVLPAKIPNMLINGSEGIAVGMATSTPPHNLAEILEAEITLMDHPDMEAKDLLPIVNGPDFPTGGIVANKKDLLSIYETGSGKIRLRGKVEVEQGKNGKQSLVITEIPYTMVGANISKFLNDVAALVETRKAPEIVDISNQSSKEGIRIVLELKKGADAKRLENLLYKKTKLEDTFGVNMLAVVDGRPETLGLKGILEKHIAFLYEIHTRKYQTLLGKEYEKKEIQEGLIKACGVIDLIIEILRGSKSKEQAKKCLVEGCIDGIAFRTKVSQKQAVKLSFTENQANAILDMRLYKLIGLEIEALEKEYAQTLKNIARYEKLLGSRTAMKKQIQSELRSFISEYGRERRTTIEDVSEAVYEETVEVTDVVFLMDRFGYCKTVDLATFEKNQDAICTEAKQIAGCKSNGKICLFTDTGIMHVVKASDVPALKWKDKGKPLDNLCQYDSRKEQVLSTMSMEEMEGKKFLFVTEKGMVKIVPGEEFVTVSKRMVLATKLEEDRLVHISEIDGEQTVVLKTKGNVFLRFRLEQVPEKKKNAVGVRGIKLAEGDVVEKVFFPDHAGEKTYKTETGEVHLDKLRIAGRDTAGTKQKI